MYYRGPIRRTNVKEGNEREDKHPGGGGYYPPTSSVIEGKALLFKIMEGGGKRTKQGKNPMT